jgi:uncharacterized protein
VKEVTTVGFDERLLVFVKVPIQGTVKTRLATAIGAETAARLYRCFVSDTLTGVRRAGYPLLVFFHPPEADRAVDAWLGEGLTCLPQRGGDLGERMFAAFQEAFRWCSRAVLVGADCPDLPDEILHEAFACLNTHDAVLGPARDGGYYLIGFSSSGGMREEIFQGIEWGSSGVHEATMAAMRMHRIHFHILPLWRDVDDYDDLKALYDRQKHRPAGDLATVDFLRDRFRW